LRLIKPGEILIAKPFLQDDYFKRSVIYMAEHNSNGSLGFVLNKPNGLLLKDIFPHLKNGNFPLFEGGPVSSNQLFYTHTLGSKISESIEIANGVFWGGNFFEMTTLMNKEMLSTTDIRFYIGYTGWSVDQLESEIEKDMWFIQPENYKKITNKFSEELWGESLCNINPSFKVFSDYTFDPSLN